MEQFETPTVEKMEARVTQDLLIGWHNNRHQLILTGIKKNQT